jgi:hypothetical protein
MNALDFHAPRYMKYATAVYGETMIRAAEMDVLGKFDSRLSPVTRTRISEHCSIPEDDIVLMDIDYGGNVSALILGLSLWSTSKTAKCSPHYMSLCFAVM